MKGSRGAYYTLHPLQDNPGSYIPVSLFSGPMVRQGNQMAITIIGDIAEFITLDQLRARK